MSKTYFLKTLSLKYIKHQDPLSEKIFQYFKHGMYYIDYSFNPIGEIYQCRHNKNLIKICIDIVTLEEINV